MLGVMVLWTDNMSFIKEGDKIKKISVRITCVKSNHMLRIGK